MRQVNIPQVVDGIHGIADAVEARQADAQTIHEALAAAGLTNAPPVGNDEAAAFYANLVQHLPAVAAQPSVSKAIASLHGQAGAPAMMTSDEIDPQVIKWLILCIVFCA
jgi:hypothetical protein